MPSSTFKEIMEREGRRRMALPGGTPARPLPLKATLSSHPPLQDKDSTPAKIRTARRTEVFTSRVDTESKPLSACDDNPVLNEQGAAFILGVSAELLKKWRQRMQGPDFIQYGPGGPVRYELKALMEFRNECRVYLRPKR